ncbi:hypothetical protein [Streptomyces spiralis]|uniref:hypothetical protein n=1 Tax=Streptomyces spiralis TaxID=66376 RepID=UPI003675D45B
MTAVSLTDWAAVLSLGTGITAAASIPYHLFVDAEPDDFDPRRLLDTTAGGRLIVEIVRAKHTVRDALLTAAALVMLLTATPEATR